MIYRWHTISYYFGLWLLLVASNLQAQLPPSLTPSSAEKQETAVEVFDVEARLQDLHQRSKELKQALDDARRTDRTQLISLLEQEQEYLLQTRLYVEQVNALQAELANLGNKKHQLQDSLQAAQATGVSDAPKSFFEVEELQNETIGMQEQLSQIKSKSENLRQLLLDSSALIRSRERELRLLKDKQRDEKDALAEQRYVLKQSERRLAEAIHEVRRLELQAEELTSDILQLSLTVDELRLSHARNGVQFAREDLQKILQELQSREEALIQQKKTARATLEKAEQRWLKLEKKAQAAPGEHRLAAEAARLIRHSEQTRLRLLAERIQRLVDSRSAWQARYVLATDSEGTPAVRQLAEQADKALERLARERRLQLAELDEVRKQMLALETDTTATSPQVKQQKRAALEQLASDFEANIRSIDQLHTLYERLGAETREKLRIRNWSDVTQSVRSVAVAIWDYELFSSGEFPVTVGKLVSGIILLLLGYVASRYISLKLSQKLISRFHLTTGAAAAIQALTFYALLVSFGLAALRLVNVPLTVFTVLGGALAIGIGFGSQNLMNNFISGLILLTEQPIRVGDLIQVDEFSGTVQKIGARSTIVRTGENIDILVPNSAFLEKNVVNWTRVNPRVRLSISIGVAYGSDTGAVTDLLKQSAVEHDDVLSQPEPFVWFKDFGDNALIFDLYFWAHVRSSADRYQVESDLRYRIEALCREKGVVIAFPQRDVHLFSSKPVAVRVLNE